MTLFIVIGSLALLFYFSLYIFVEAQILSIEVNKAGYGNHTKLSTKNLNIKMSISDLEAVPKFLL